MDRIRNMNGYKMPLKAKKKADTIDKQMCS